MRRGVWLAAWLGGSGCGTPPPAPPARPAVVVASPPQAPRAPAHVVVLASTDSHADGYRDLHFAHSGRLLVRGPLGLHRIDPQSGSEQLLFRLPAQAEVQSMYAGSMVLVRWSEATLGMHLDVLDVESGRRLVLPEAPASTPGTTTSHVTLAPDGSSAVWIDTRDGHGVVLDTQTGKTLHELAATQALPASDAKFSSSGRYLVAGGGLRDLQTGREVLRLLIEGLYKTDGMSFVTVGGRDALVYAHDKFLTLFVPETRQLAEADIDCLKNQAGYREAVLPKLDVFVRLCPRGALTVDLQKLASHSGPKPLAPVRVKDVYSFRADQTTLLFGLRQSRQVARAFGSLDGEYMALWQRYDPRTGKSTPEPAPTPSVVQTAGAFRIELSAQDSRCTLLGVPPEALPTTHDLCSASLSDDGRYLATTSNGALTIATLPALETAYAAGDSLTRNDASQNIVLGVEDGAVRVRATSYSGRFAENEFEIPRDTSLRPLDFRATPDDFTVIAGDDPRKIALLAAVEPRFREHCKQIGLLDHDTIGLLQCTLFEAESFVRYDVRTLALISPPRTGQPSRERPGLGTLDGLLFDVDARTPTLQMVQIRDEASKEILAHLHLGWDFAIVTDSNDHVQIVGNRKRAATWLRCLIDGPAAKPPQLTPFETCAGQVEAKLF